uniref:Uncharacterized protein n=1 Tax=Rhizophora mucronata TaxID=61149 RepID=A0A2P2PM03_RHIMU
MSHMSRRSLPLGWTESILWCYNQLLHPSISPLPNPFSLHVIRPRMVVNFIKLGQLPWVLLHTLQ